MSARDRVTAGSGQKHRICTGFLFDVTAERSGVISGDAASGNPGGSPGERVGGIIAYDALMDGDIDMAFAYIESLALAVSTYALVVVAPVARYFAKKQQLSGLLKDIEKCKNKPSCGKIKEI